ncbi:MAG: arginine--tRNA ligase, partial [Candidatus Nealsonbacteria bacterium]
MIRQEIIRLIQKITGESSEKIQVTYPEGDGFGDYTTNIALRLKKPANEIAENLKSDLFEKVEVAGPGFINFFISKEYLQKQVNAILKEKDKFGQLKIGKGQKVNVEFVSANPTGPLTVGNARGGPFGDTLANILEKAGYKAYREYYVNDTGKQIELLKNYGYNNEYTNELKKRGEENVEKSVKFIVSKIKKTTERMGIRFDKWFFESDLHKKKAVDKIIKILKKKNLIYDQDGAQWFSSSKYGDQRDRVLIKTDGSKTYLAGDIAYHQYKLKKFNKAINIWGADHYGDVPGLKAGVEALGYKDKLDIILLQFVSLIEGGKGLKMSKRKGIYISMDELLDAVGTDVARFFFLTKSADTHLNFDLALAKEQSDKNPVYYIQYAHARICSILRKAKMSEARPHSNLLEHPAELKLIRQLIRFSEIIEDTAKDYQIQRLPQYAVDLATTFH